MPLRKRATLSLSCFIALVLSANIALAGDEATPKRIPTDAQPAAATSRIVDDGGEDNTRSFNTPTDDGRPGEYYFALGVQATKKGDYAHAMAMYKVAASWAYKPAEYNLGVMYLNGQGSPVDLPRALAWMALAAERKDAEYVRARQLVYANVTPEQYEQANVIWRDLLPTYGDDAALPRATSRWREARDNATGSRVGSGAVHVMVGGAGGTPNHMSSPHYISDVHVSTNPGEVAGVHQGDGAVAYQALRSTDNPYDPKVMPVTGQATVGALSQVATKAGDATGHGQDSSKDGDGSGHP